MRDEPPTPATSRLITPVAWLLLLLGLWLWAVRLTDGGFPPSVLDNLPGIDRVDGSRQLPAAHEPLAGTAQPRLLRVEELGVRAEIVDRGVDATGGVAPPPFERPELVGWYADGPTPGAAGAAVLVGHVDTDTEPAVFYGLSSTEPGGTVAVTRDDGTIAEFTVEKIDVIERADFDAEQVYGPDQDGRAELRLITCGGTFDAERQTYSANVVVSAYLTDAARQPTSTPGAIS